MGITDFVSEPPCLEAAGTTLFVEEMIALFCFFIISLFEICRYKGKQFAQHAKIRGIGTSAMGQRLALRGESAYPKATAFATLAPFLPLCRALKS
ncbi:MAG: hypothetical protein IK000_01465 [Bacteroidaceae bacterium]|nr:hypothetical protein [Bacteroidaceae bacterium]